MNRLVCLDSQISAWIYSDEAPTKENAIFYTKSDKLIQALGEAGYRILVPNIVLSEIACIYTEEKQVKFFNELPKGLIIGEFTLSTSRILARILHQRFFIEKKEYNNKGITKDKMKYDSMILAIAVDMGADCLYSVDKDFRKYSKSYIDILGLDDTPPSYNKGSLFDSM